ncbi:MAG: LCP family protein [Actinomycetota bacterium]
MSEPEPSVPHAHGPATRWFVAVSALLSIVIAAGSAYAFTQYQAAKTEGQCDWAGCKPGETANAQPSGAGAPVGPCADDVCNYLLLGSDSRKGLTQSEIDQFGSDATIGGENRADTIMLVHTDPNLQKAIIVSFPRDLWVNIPGHGYDKINAAFEGGIEGGGPLLVAKTIHALTGLKINHYLYVDLAGFQGVVKTLGGVDMCISGENVNTPGYVEGESGSVYYPEPGYIADPYTGLHIKPGCQTLPPDQALAYVRARHLKCDAAAPDFYRIGRQQQFMRALITKMLQPDELLQLPGRIRPILSNMKRDPDLNPADLAYLVGQLRGISTGAAEFRAVPGYGAYEGGLAVIKMDQSANQIFRAIRQGEPLGDAGTVLVNTPPSEANIVVPVVDHASGGEANGVEQILADAGFDVAPGIVAYDAYGATVNGSVIAYAPGHQVEAEVVKKYFPTLEVKEVKGLPDHVAVFVTSTYEPAPIGAGAAPSDCVPANA